MNTEKKLFLKALQEKFDEDPAEENTKFYCYGGKTKYFMYSEGEATHNPKNHKFGMDLQSVDYLKFPGINYNYSFASSSRPISNRKYKFHLPCRTLRYQDHKRRFLFPDYRKYDVLYQ